MNIFADIKAQLDLTDIAQYYGVRLNRGGFANCLYHPDKTPSMKIYDDHFHCYGCGKHGDVITLTGQIFSLSPYAAAQKLSQDFHINKSENSISVNTNIKQKSYAEKENIVFKMLNDYCHFLEEYREKYNPQNPNDELHPLFVESLTNYETYNYYRDIFIFGTKEERIQFMKDFKEEKFYYERNLCPTESAVVV